MSKQTGTVPGRRVLLGVFENHDYLWFSSFEISKVAATSPVIHNYALSYALSQFSRAISGSSTPSYEEDLARMPLYATPARPLHHPQFVRLTQNAINSRSLRTDDGPRDANTPDIGWRGVLTPMSELGAPPLSGAVLRGYKFYAFVRNEFAPPAVVRLGKKGCSIRIRWSDLSHGAMQFIGEAREPSHAVNPLDVVGDIESYEPVMIPPHLVLTRARIRNDWFVVSGEHTIHVPKRLIQ